MTDLFSFAGVSLNDQIYRGKLRGHPVYRVWSSMVTRCENPNATGYKYYGGRGISVCAEWRNSSRLFISWALANGWRKGLELDRIDNDADYCPENCRFVTRTQNARNTRHTLRLRDGSALAAAVPTNGLSMQAVRDRVRAGVDPDDALSLPSRYYRVLSDGRAFYEAARAAGVPVQTAYKRLRRGWSIDDAATVPSGGKRPAPK